MISEKELDALLVSTDATLRGYYEERIKSRGLLPVNPSWRRAPADFYVHHQRREGAGHCTIQAVGRRFKVVHVLGPTSLGSSRPEVGRFDSFEEAADAVRLVLDAELAAVRLTGDTRQECEWCSGTGNASNHVDPCSRCRWDGL